MIIIPISSQALINSGAGILWEVRIALHPMSFRIRIWRRIAASLTAAPNNPSVVMWCIGNEVPNQWNEGDCKIAKWLQDICHREDPTRPVTQGMDAPDAVVNNNFAAVMDVAGFNYRPFKYKINYKKLPQRIVLGSETASGCCGNYEAGSQGLSPPIHRRADCNRSCI